jgi:hypothetical protein
VTPSVDCGQVPDNVVFLSYAAVDRPRVEPLVRGLESQGLDVWWDRDIARGQNFSRAIEAALERATCALVVWSAASVQSEWVFNEASEARKRQMLVPVLIDDVTPPLEFRHLQAARLVGWEGDMADPEWAELMNAVQARLARKAAADAPTLEAGHVSAVGAIRYTNPAVEARHHVWWRTPAGVAAGAGALLAGVALLLLALVQLGVLGAASVSPPNEPTGAAADGPSRGTAADTTRAASASREESAPAEVASAPVGSTTAERVNLLSPELGGALLIASENGWSLTQTAGNTTVVSLRGFAVFGFRGGKAATVDGLGVFVEYTNDRNAKTLVLSASDVSETGPFRKVAEVTIPNFRNMRGPVHELAVTPFSAKFVRLEVTGWQNGDWGNGYLGTIQLLGHQP